MPSIPKKQLAILSAFILASLVIAIGPGRYLLSFAYHTGDQSYILLVPVISAMLIYRNQDAIFTVMNPGMSGASMAGLIGGSALLLLGYALPYGTELQMVTTACGLIGFWVGAFIYCFGTKSARVAAFPLGMLLWIIPIPAVCIDWITVSLQVASTELVAILFSVTRVPVLRDGFVFHLSTQSIEVAKECSGIRSSLCLILLTLAISYESLRGTGQRLILALSTIPIVVLKNGVRIVSLTLLAIYVDPSFLTGPLHHRGGIVFFILGMLMLVPVLKLLQRVEKTTLSRPVAARESVATASR